MGEGCKKKKEGREGSRGCWVRECLASVRKKLKTVRFRFSLTKVDESKDQGPGFERSKTKRASETAERISASWVGLSLRSLRWG